ncbi:TPA: hypothetical protein ACXNIM_002399, partial [Stenotrophomonas maltophilia]
MQIKFDLLTAGFAVDRLAGYEETLLSTVVGLFRIQTSSWRFYRELLGIGGGRHRDIRNLLRSFSVAFPPALGLVAGSTPPQKSDRSNQTRL